MADGKSDHHLWFSHAVEALFVRGLGARLTPDVRARIEKTGINLSKLQPAYPITQLLAACRAVIPVLYPRLPESEGFRQLGVSFMQGYAETLVGRAMVQMMKIIGPRRTLERMQKNFRTGGNLSRDEISGARADVGRVVDQRRHRDARLLRGDDRRRRADDRHEEPEGHHHR